MSIVSVILWAALSSAQALQPEGWFHAGVEKNRHVLVSLGGVPQRPTAPFLASLTTIPVDWPANGSTYQTWIAEFDCAAGTRTMKFRMVYSSRHDPVRTELTNAPVESSDGAIAAQLAILCGRNDTRAAPRLFNNVGEFTRGLRE